MGHVRRELLPDEGGLFDLRLVPAYLLLRELEPLEKKLHLRIIPMGRAADRLRLVLLVHFSASMR